MKKVISLIVMLAACFAVMAASSIDPTKAGQSKPSNILVYTIGSGTGQATADTFAASAATTGCHVYGPLQMSVDNSRPCFAGFRVFSPNLGTTASTGNLEVSYQQLASNSLADTTATWVLADTVVPGGSSKTLVSLSSLPSQSIVIRLRNYGSSVTAILKKIRVVFYSTATETNKAGGGF